MGRPQEVGEIEHRAQPPQPVSICIGQSSRTVKTCPTCGQPKSSDVGFGDANQNTLKRALSGVRTKFTQLLPPLSGLRSSLPSRSSDMGLDHEESDNASIRHGNGEPDHSPLTSRLLRLPYRLQHDIFSLLSNPDRLSLSLTCRQLHEDGAVLLREEKGGGFLSRNQRLDVLKRLRHDPIFVDHWPCSCCSKFHRAKVGMRDTPATRRDGLKIILPLCYEDWNTQGLYTPLRSYQLSSRHITLALRYHALRKKHPERVTELQLVGLDRLMSPHHTACTLSWDRALEETLHSVFPKIVNGRFLLFSTWVHPVPNPARKYTVDLGYTLDLFICKHLGMRWMEYPRLSYVCAQKHKHSLESSSKDTTCCDYWKDRLRNETRRALDHPGVTFKGSCLYCPTDFSVMLDESSHSLLFCSWQDLGTLATQVDSPLRVSMDWNRRGRGKYYHKAGSIQAAYDSGFESMESLLRYLINETPSWNKRLQSCGDGFDGLDEGQNYHRWRYYRPMSRGISEYDWHYHGRVVTYAEDF